ncbi:MAG TPA: DUF1003 domain-containing protein [Pseudonocardiaceae bacterium]|nr:DUF1003 domain-containing protein [Pseudonocardiaceae bacterium]
MASPLVPTVVAMPELYSGRRLDRPRSVGLRRPTIDPDSFARFSERVARFLGTGRYLVIQTIIVAIWMGLNVTAVVWRFDPYPDTHLSPYGLPPEIGLEDRAGWACGGSERSAALAHKLGPHPHRSHGRDLPARPGNANTHRRRRP